MAILKNIIFILLWLGIITTGISLGRWQLDRLAWKEAWLARIDAAYTEPPLAQLPDDPGFSTTFFARARLELKFDPKSRLIVMPRVYHGNVGAHIYERATAKDGKILLVNRGFVQQENLDKIVDARKETVSVQLHPPSWQGQYTDMHGQTYSFMEKNLGYRDYIAVIEPSTEQTEMSPTPVGERPILPNDHFSYAIFWFVMSGVAALFGIGLFIRARLLHQEVGVRAIG